MVSGKPYNGTGVGFNALANIGGPRLSAVETFTEPQNSTLAGIETALLPNAVYYNPGATNIQSPNPIAAGNPFAGYDPGDNPFANLGAAYASYEGPGGSDESYDAADYQNMFLAMQSVTPRARARVFEDTNPAAVISENIEEHYSHGGAPPARLDLEDVTLPSFHRPDLVNFWYHRLYNAPWVVAAYPDSHDRVRAILQPNMTTPLGALIAGIKRRIILRPLPEDHPEFDGSNPISRYRNTAALPNGDLVNAGPDGTLNGSNNSTDDQITFPAWEVAGPWDVDNDNDGIPDSVWVDTGLPVQKTEDGRFYKPLVAYLIQDMDGRLNLNAHGTSEDLFARVLDNPSNPIDLDRSNIGGNFNGAQPGNLASFGSSNVLPHGEGWGPAEISLRPILSPPGLTYYAAANSPFGLDGLTVGQQSEDDYTRLLIGRPEFDGVGNPSNCAMVAWGRNGSYRMNGAMNAQGSLVDPATGNAFPPATLPIPAPGVNFSKTSNATALVTTERQVPYDFVGYPVYDDVMYKRLYGSAPVSGFGVAPDMNGSYAVGLDFRGQLVHEAANDVTRTPSALHDSPYELNIMSAARRDNVANMISTAASYGTAASVPDDAAFAPSELEKILREFDPDASRLPDRLWNLVDALDAKKLVASISANPATPTSADLAQADLQAAINRRQVTTDSFSVPTPNDNWMSRIQFGADGYPGVAGFDDDNNSTVDDMSELNWANSDDYQVVMLTAPPTGAGIVDYLRYRIVLELRKQNVITAATLPATVDALVNQIMHGNNSLATNVTRNARYSFGGLMSQETLAGLKMDLNRPFGDGRDNNGNGVVDEELEAGEPVITQVNSGRLEVVDYLDLDGDGLLYQDHDNNGVLYVDTNSDGVPDTIDSGDLVDLDGAGPEPPQTKVDSLWQQQLGAPAPFDHARGQDASASGKLIDDNNNGRWDENNNGRRDNGDDPFIHDDARLAPQLYARHLYCMMLLLVDENYLRAVRPDRSADDAVLRPGERQAHQRAARSVGEHGVQTGPRADQHASNVVHDGQQLRWLQRQHPR